jgi:hypothetical protein
MMRAFSIAVQEARGDQIGQKAVNRAYGQPRQGRHLLCGETLRRFAKKMQQPQPTLKSGNVVTTFVTNVHRNRQNESAELSDENHFYAIPRFIKGGRIS